MKGSGVRGGRGEGGQRNKGLGFRVVAFALERLCKTDTCSTNPRTPPPPKKKKT